MDNLIKILVVEGETTLAAKLALQLTGMGYEVTGTLTRGEEVMSHLDEKKPDIILLDTRPSGKMDGIRTAQLVQKNANPAIIFLTSPAEEINFEKAKLVKPYATIMKPYKQLDLQRAIEQTISRIAENETGPRQDEHAASDRPFILKDRIFARHREKMIKIFVEDILYVEADRNYCRIFTHNKEHLLAITLKSIEEKLSDQIFLRTHRSYIVNLLRVEAVGESHLIIARKTIPLSTGVKQQLLQKLAVSYKL